MSLGGTYLYFLPFKLFLEGLFLKAYSRPPSYLTEMEPLIGFSSLGLPNKLFLFIKGSLSAMGF